MASPAARGSPPSSVSSRQRARALGLRQLRVDLPEAALQGLDAHNFDLLINRQCLHARHDSLVIVSSGDPARDHCPCILHCQSRVGLLQAADGVLLHHTAPDAPVEVGAGSAPMEALANDTLGLHASSAVVQVSELASDLRVQRRQLLLARFDLDLNFLRGGAAHDKLGGSRALQHRVQRLQIRVQAVHQLFLLRRAELHLDDACGLENAASRLDVRIHLHLCRIDGRIDDHPRAASQLASGRDVHEDGVLVIDQGIDDLGTKFENLVVHVPGAAGEAAPIREDDERQVLAVVEVADRGGRLEGTVREPNLPSLRLHHLLTQGVRRVCRHTALNVPRLHGNDAHGNTAELGPSHDDAAAPSLEVLLEGALVEKSRQALALGRRRSREHMARIVGYLGGHERNVAVHGVRRLDHRCHAAGSLGCVGEPRQDGTDTILITLHQLVRDTVGHHHLRTS
mmetsp:Transcript_106671/g.340410  ORF Transcript_106671/g.340410 Transcript_106671/m.340410 type:complete len:455 (-) Transcript_106671:5304-6668(-)